MGSEQDVRPDDDLRRRLLAVRNLGWRMDSDQGVQLWDRLVDDLIAAVRADERRIMRDV